ncbi:MAG: YbjQ family protein [Planctomycetaceae bacterium]|nr:YbjQ family protein [Planctomycetaceae bacterium]
MIVTTTLDVQGYEITEYLGVVRGITVRSPTISQGFLGGLKSIIGGQIGSFTNMCDDARQQAFEYMLGHAEHLGADAIVGVRYDASDVGHNISATEVLCYSTAVRLSKIV